MGRWAKVKDRWARVSVLTPRRAVNLLQLSASYRRAKRSGQPQMPPNVMPTSLSIEPTTSCNLRCPECPSGLRSFTRPTGMLNVDHACRWIDELAPWLTYVNLYFQGEPLLHPKLDQLMAQCHRHGIYSSTSTNAHHLTEAKCEALIDAGLSRLIVSIDGLTQETYASYRVGGTLSKVMEGTRNMVEAKRRRGRGPHLVWQFLVVGPNEHELPDLLEAASACGVDEVEIKTAQLDDPQDGHPLLTEAAAHRRYDRDPITGQWMLRNALEDACWRMWQGAVLTWDGRVVPCCFDKDAHYVMGQLGDQGMAEIWHNAEYAAFRRTLFADRSGIPMCTNCSEGSHVYA
ncbi:MAG: radical SAM/SPASM domain-containing protein [Flavobacteriales bacterium]